MNPERIFSLFADQHSVSHMGRNLRSSGGSNGLQELLILFAVLVVAGVAVYLVVRYTQLRNRISYTSPGGLFRELCMAHALDRNEQQMLKSLARQEGINQPAHLFLAPECFQEERIANLRKYTSEQFMSLRAKLFGEDSPTSDTKS